MAYKKDRPQEAEVLLEGSPVDEGVVEKNRGVFGQEVTPSHRVDAEIRVDVE